MFSLLGGDVSFVVLLLLVHFSSLHHIKSRSGLVSPPLLNIRALMEISQRQETCGASESTVRLKEAETDALCRTRLLIYTLD